MVNQFRNQLSHGISIMRSTVVLRSVVAVAAILCASTANSQIVKWEIEATVFEIEDPDMAFPDIRIGDSVRGFLSYDLSTTGDDEDPNDVLYSHNPAFEVVGMVIENPRDGSELEFIPDRDFLADVKVSNDQEIVEVGLIDIMSAFQSVVSPDGYSGLAPTIGVTLDGPPETLPDASLPNVLNLDDWPDAVLVFVDFFDFVLGEGEFESGYIAAEIHTLTPVIIPDLAGDFNKDGTVDAGDYVVWRHGLGTGYDQADYEDWRANFGASAAASAASVASAPEPASAITLTTALIAIVFVRRRSPQNCTYKVSRRGAEVAELE
jgi:hypothetical protein